MHLGVLMGGVMQRRLTWKGGALSIVCTGMPRLCAPKHAKLLVSGVILNHALPAVLPLRPGHTRMQGPDANTTGGWSTAAAFCALAHSMPRGATCTLWAGHAPAQCTAKSIQHTAHHSLPRLIIPTLSRNPWGGDNATSSFETTFPVLSAARWPPSKTTASKPRMKCACIRIYCLTLVSGQHCLAAPQ